MTSTIPKGKLKKLQALSFIELKVIEGDPQLGELAARKYAEDNGLKVRRFTTIYTIIGGVSRESRSVTAHKAWLRV